MEDYYLLLPTTTYYYLLLPTTTYYYVQYCAVAIVLACRSSRAWKSGSTTT